MGRMGYKKIFRDKDKLRELKELLDTKRGYSDIARHFGVDHTTIIYHSRKMGYSSRPMLINSQKHCVTCNKKISPYALRCRKCSHKYGYKKGKGQQVEKIVAGERINQGKSYREYLAEEKKRSKVSTVFDRHRT